MLLSVLDWDEIDCDGFCTSFNFAEDSDLELSKSVTNLFRRSSSFVNTYMSRKAYNMFISESIQLLTEDLRTVE